VYSKGESPALLIALYVVKVQMPICVEHGDRGTQAKHEDNVNPILSEVQLFTV
jgi:hypothetical protein